MATTMTFSDDLWDGFDRVYSRLTEGRHDMKKMEAYLKQRAKIEEVYAKSLAEASKQTGFVTKHTIAQCWTDIHSSGSSIAKQHLQWSIMCNEICQKLDTMVSTVKDLKTKLQNTHTGLLKDKEAKQGKHTKCKEAFAASVAAAETAITNFKKGKKTLPEKKIAKLKNQVEKAVKDIEKCNTAYTEAVLVLRTTEESFAEKVATMLKQFETQEMARTLVLKEQVERYVQAQDFYKNAIEQIGTFSQKGAASVALEKDIQDFIETNKTSDKRPKYTEYVAIENAVIFEYCDGKGSVVGSSTSSSPTMAVSKASVSADPSTASPTSSPPETKAAPVATASATAAAPAVEYATALYDFVSAEADDLPFVTGDVVTLVSCPAGEEWWQGTLNGASGMFPTTYVEKMDAKAATAATVTVAAPGTPKAAPGGPTPTPAADAAAEPTQTLGGQTPQLLDAKCTSLYQFAGEDTDELSFQAGEELQITGQIDDWYLGKSAAGAVGIFPANYVSRHDS